MIDWSAVSALTDLFKLLRENSRKKQDDQEPRYQVAGDEKIRAAVEQSKCDSYQKALGVRHRLLRENFLRLNPREMADFYGYEKVRFLEECEAGQDEFPRVSMQRLEECFFVRRSHIEEADERIFQSFPLLYTEDGCAALLEQGFKPQIITSPLGSKMEDICYVIFLKKEDRYFRTVISNTQGNFQSSGGGRANVVNLICALKRAGRIYEFVSVSHARSDQDWTRLETNTFYSNGPYVSAGGADYKNQSIYESWIEEVNKGWKCEQVDRGK